MGEQENGGDGVADVGVFLHKLAEGQEKFFRDRVGQIEASFDVREAGNLGTVGAKAGTWVRRCVVGNEGTGAEIRIGIGNL